MTRQCISEWSEFICNPLADTVRGTTVTCFLLVLCLQRVLGKRGHCDLNIRSILIGAVVTSRAEALQQTALYRNHLKELPGAA